MKTVIDRKRKKWEMNSERKKEKRKEKRKPNEKVSVKVRAGRQNEVSRRSSFLADKLEMLYSRPALTLGAQGGCAKKTVTPLLSTVKYMFCVCLMQRGFCALLKREKFFEQSQCVPRTGPKPEMREKKGRMDKCTTCFCQVASGLKPTFFVKC